MLTLREFDRENNYRMLSHGRDVFHKALSFVLLGETRFHVKGPSGIAYDLVYEENQAWAESSGRYPDAPIFQKNPLYPPYLTYDETAEERLCLDAFADIRKIVFEEVSEYTVVLAGVLLAHTDLAVSFADERIRWFYPEESRIEIVPALPPGRDSQTIKVVKAFHPSFSLNDYHTLDPAAIFHDVFLFQWMSEKDLRSVKYAEILVARSEGIGSILTLYARMGHFLERFGTKVTLAPGSSRYADAILEKYFDVRMTPADADESNTICITNYYGILFTKMLRISKGHDFDLGMLNPRFLSEMEEYGDAVFHKKRMLGILLRGSDYIASGMSGASAPVSVASALPKIREWMSADGYDGIFLATEDQDLLDEMRAAFPGKVLAAAQERYSIRDFEEVKTISELDRLRHPGEEYDAFVEDSLVNYFYALYLLSRCESFMYSGQCGGVVLAKGMCRDGFKRVWSFAEGKEKAR